MKRIVLIILSLIVVLSCDEDNSSVTINGQYSRGKTEYFLDGKKIYETTSSYFSDDDIEIEVIGVGPDISLAGYFAEMIFPYDIISFNKDGYLYMGDAKWYKYTSSHIIYSDNEIRGLIGKNINYTVKGNSVTFEINYQDAGCRVTSVVNTANGSVIGNDGKTHEFVEKVTFKKH